MFAYLDPGTGSLALQASVAGLLGAIFVVKSCWRQLKQRVFGRAE
jgi:hypothetical protein